MAHLLTRMSLWFSTSLLVHNSWFASESGPIADLWPRISGPTADWTGSQIGQTLCPLPGPVQFCSTWSCVCFYAVSPYSPVSLVSKLSVEVLQATCHWTHLLRDSAVTQVAGTQATDSESLLFCTRLLWVWDFWSLSTSELSRLSDGKEGRQNEKSDSSSLAELGSLARMNFKTHLSCGQGIKKIKTISGITVIVDWGWCCNTLPRIKEL